MANDIMQGAPAEPSELLDVQDQFTGYVDYFDTDETETVTLPDGKQYVTVRLLNEGDRRTYLNKMQRDIRVERESGDAHLRMATGDERFHLLTLAITGWNLVTFNKKKNALEPIPYNDKNLRDFLQNANPRVLDVIEKKVREMNEWLTPTETTIEAINEEIERLEDQKRKLEERESGNDS